MDRIDRAIIEILSKEGRILNVELADRVGLTPGPCLRRMQRLERDGVILGYRAVVSAAAIKRSFEVILDVDLSDLDRDSVLRFENELASKAEVLEMRRMFGAPDYLVRVGVENFAAYEKFLTEQVLVLPGIDKVNSRFTMKSVKSAEF